MEHQQSWARCIAFELKNILMFALNYTACVYTGEGFITIQLFTPCYWFYKEKMT